MYRPYGGCASFQHLPNPVTNKLVRSGKPATEWNPELFDIPAHVKLSFLTKGCVVSIQIM